MSISSFIPYKFVKEDQSLQQDETSEKLEKLPERIQFPRELEKKIRYDSSKKLLVWQGVMTEKDREELLKLSTDEQYREAIEKLFHLCRPPSIEKNK